MTKKHQLKQNSIALSLYPKISSFSKRKHPGLIKIEAGRILHKHELETITKLLSFGDDIFCQAESKFVKTADIIWRDETWEIKRIQGNSPYTITHSLQKAKKQSVRIILDISNSQITINRSIGRIKEVFRKNKEVIKVMVISKENYCILDRNLL